MMTYLSVKQWRVVVDVSDLYGERADALEGGLSRVDGLDGHADLLAVFALAVKHLVGEQLSRLLVHVELGPLLVGLLDDRVPDLPVDTLVLVHRVDFDDRGPVGGALFNLGRVGGAVLEK